MTFEALTSFWLAIAGTGVLREGDDMFLSVGVQASGPSFFCEISDRTEVQSTIWVGRIKRVLPAPLPIMASIDGFGKDRAWCAPWEEVGQMRPKTA